MNRSFGDLKEALDFRFKGSRDYLHGTDILTACLEALERRIGNGELTDIDIVFHRMAQEGLTLTAAENIPKDGLVANFACRLNGESHKFMLMGDGRCISGRVPYPEEEIVAATSFDFGTYSASSSAPLPFNNIERWVAMVKALHNRVYANREGKWLFVRGKFLSYVSRSPNASHAVAITSNLQDKFTRSVVSMDGVKIGDIFFSLVSK